MEDLMRDVDYFFQPSANVVQLDAAPQHSIPYRQSTSTTQAGAARTPQQRMAPLPGSHQAEMHWSQPQAPPATTSHTPVFRPQSHHPAQAQRHPLQPGQPMNRAGSSSAQKDSEQVAAMQRQLQYLHHLEQQHQRPLVQQQQTTFPVSRQIALPALSYAAQITNSTSLVEQATLTPDVPPPTIEEVPASAVQSPMMPPTSSQPDSGDPAAETSTALVSIPTPSPAKIRTRRPFSLHDLRLERRHSSGRSSSSATLFKASDSREASFSANIEPSEANGANQGKRYLQPNPSISMLIRLFNSSRRYSVLNASARQSPNQ